MKAITQEELDKMIKSGVIKEQKLYYPDNPHDLYEKSLKSGYQVGQECRHDEDAFDCGICKLCVGNYIDNFEYTDGSDDIWDCILHAGVREKAGTELANRLLEPISIEHKLNALEL